MANSQLVELRSTFLEQYTFQKRVLVPKHEALICCRSVAVLQSLQCLLMMLYGGLKLFDIFSTALSERRLGLPISLFSLLGRCINLELSVNKQSHFIKVIRDYRLASTLSFLHLSVFLYECLLIRFRGRCL